MSCRHLSRSEGHSEEAGARHRLQDIPGNHVREDFIFLVNSSSASYIPRLKVISTEIDSQRFSNASIILCLYDKWILPNFHGIFSLRVSPTGFIGRCFLVTKSKTGGIDRVYIIRSERVSPAWRRVW